MDKYKYSLYILGGCLVFLISIGFVRNAINTIQNNSRLSELESQVLGLQIQKQDLEKEISFQQSDEYIEQEARNKLNLIKQGEQLYVVSQDLDEEIKLHSNLDVRNLDESVDTKKQNQVKRVIMEFLFDKLISN